MSNLNSSTGGAWLQSSRVRKGKGSHTQTLLYTCERRCHGKHRTPIQRPQVLDKAPAKVPLDRAVLAAQHGICDRTCAVQCPMLPVRVTVQEATGAAIAGHTGSHRHMHACMHYPCHRSPPSSMSPLMPLADILRASASTETRLRRLPGDRGVLSTVEH